MAYGGEVIAGDYEGKSIFIHDNSIPYISVKSSFFGEREEVLLSKDIIDSYEVITDEHTKSAASGIARGIVGGVLLGPVGMLAGALSAKNKSKHTIAIQFKNGKKSLIEVEGSAYKALTKEFFEMSRLVSADGKEKECQTIYYYKFSFFTPEKIFLLCLCGHEFKLPGSVSDGCRNFNAQSYTFKVSQLCPECGIRFVEATKKIL
jgi:hypothetical protein